MSGVDLPESHRSASEALIEVLRAGARAVPALAGPAAALRRDALGESVLRYEAARCALPGADRVAAAQAVVEASQSLLRWCGADGAERPLSRAIDPAIPRESARRVVMARHAGASPERGAGGSLGRGAAGRSAPGLVPRVPLAGRVVEREAIAGLAEAMLARRAIAPATADVLRWLAARPAIDLRGARFVVMGAAAELAPTEVLLAAGAEVLYLDIAPAARWIECTRPCDGTLVWPERTPDLLADPGAVLEAILAFAEGAPVHLGLFGYAGGANREWRLAAAMNAIVRAMPAAQVASIGMYLSPTSPAQPCDVDAGAARERALRPGAGERMWRAAGVLRPNLLEVDGRAWVRSVVAMQGSSYLAAQYVEKRLAAEVFAMRGTGAAGEGTQSAVRPIVSAQVAGVTRTASMDIPAFNAALVGAAVLGVESYAPTTTRWLSAMLYLEHLLNPDSSARRAREGDASAADLVHATQVHGGLYAYPWAIDGALKRAAVIGLAHQPSLIPKLFGGGGRPRGRPVD